METHLLPVFLLLLSHAKNSLPRPVDNESFIKEEAMLTLLKIFGVDSKTKPNFAPYRVRNRPPQYMLDLYNSVADDSGFVHTSKPYDAKVVRSYPSKATEDNMRFVFDTSTIGGTEEIIQAEFHIFKIKPRRHHRPLSSSHSDHIVEIRVYQTLPFDKHNPVDRNLLEVRRISLYSVGWEVFRVGQAVQEWVRNPELNLGLEVEMMSLNGKRLAPGMGRMAKRREHSTEKQPLLVVFTDDGRTKSRKKEGRTGNATETNMIFQNTNAARARVKRETESASDVSAHLPTSSGMKTIGKAKENGLCIREELYVDFESIGWSDWIIFPKGYQAYHCKGSCPFPLEEEHKPTNHATVQSIVNALQLTEQVTEPCCVPEKLLPISLLYFDEHENVVLKQYEDMVVASCGCH